MSLNHANFQSLISLLEDIRTKPQGRELSLANFYCTKHDETRACFAGWTTFLMGNISRYVQDEDSIDNLSNLAADWLGLSSSQATKLFYGYPSSTTLDQGISILHHLAAHGELPSTL